MSDAFNKAGQKFQDAAKAAAKRVTFEKDEYLKTAQGQLGSPEIKKPEGPSMVDEIITGGGVTTSVSDVEHNKIHANESERIQKLQSEIKMFGVERERKLEEWRKDQEKLLNKGQETEGGRILTEPSAKPKRGLFSNRHKSKGNVEIVSSKK